MTQDAMDDHMASIAREIAEEYMIDIVARVSRDGFKLLAEHMSMRTMVIACMLQEDLAVRRLLSPDPEAVARPVKWYREIIDASA